MAVGPLERRSAVRVVLQHRDGLQGHQALQQRREERQEHQEAGVNIDVRQIVIALTILERTATRAVVCRGRESRSPLSPTRMARQVDQIFLLLQEKNAFQGLAVGGMMRGVLLSKNAIVA